jgi:hypothetical protein
LDLKGDGAAETAAFYHGAFLPWSPTTIVRAVLHQTIRPHKLDSALRDRDWQGPNDESERRGNALPFKEEAAT